MQHTLKFDTSKPCGPFKFLNGSNGGPFHKRHATDQYRSNFENYKKARIPYSKNHDSGMIPLFGGPYAHDISKIFRNFDADVNDPASYDFACTDESILVTLEAGTKTYFRLGECIEHQIKKHATLPPKDFHKWAEICEHIIMHYTEGWANGHHLDMEHWMIWCEPDLDPDDSPNKRLWGGTQAQFFDLYEITAKRLKARFPHLKIGGPGLAGNEEWAAQFICEMSKRNVPIDFFSWHIYCTTPQQLIGRAERLRACLDQYGYTETENHLTEWNYVKGWREEYIYSISTIHGIKGAAFEMACISSAQNSSIDVMLYYDTRPSVFNGLFDYYTYKPLKGYYPFYWYGMFYDMAAEIKAENQVDDIYTLCGISPEGKVMATVTYYTDDDAALSKKVSVDFGKPGKYEIYLLDEEHSGELYGTTSDLDFEMKRNSVILIKEI